jgi:hypothetical protein
MKLSSVKTVTIVPAQSAITMQADTIKTKWIDDGNSVRAELTFSNSTANPFITRRTTITLWDATTTPTYTVIGNWTKTQAEARVLTILGL